MTPRTDRAGVAVLLRAAAGVCACILSGSVAFGHEDLRIVDATVTVEPGAAVTYPTAVHYHRIVGRYALVDPDADAGAPDVSIGLAVAPPAGNTADTGSVDPSRTGGFEATLVATLAPRGTFDALIRCCDGRDWTPAELLVRNDGDRPATLRLRAWAVHDEFAVVVDRAESGAMEVPLTLFSAFGGLALVVAARERRRGRTPGDPATLPTSVRVGVGLLVASFALAVALGAAGAVRYGAGPIAGMVAILADLPVPGGPFGSRAATLMGVLMLAWLAAIGAWIRTLHLGAHRNSPWPRRLGGTLGGASLGVGVAIGWTYGSFGVPMALALPLAAPLLGIAATMRPPAPVVAPPSEAHGA